MIRWMLWGRQYGKTYQVIKWFLEDPEHRVIVTSNAIMVDDLLRRVTAVQSVAPWDADQDSPAARKYWQDFLKKSIIRYTTADQLIGRKVDVAVDNLDMILHTMFAGNEVRMVTATGVNESPVGLCVDPQMARYAQYIQDR